MHFGKSAANFGIAAAESYPTGRRTDEMPKLPALFPKCMHCRLNWPEKGVVAACNFAHLANAPAKSFVAVNASSRAATYHVFTSTIFSWFHCIFLSFFLFVIHPVDFSNIVLYGATSDRLEVRVTLYVYAVF